MNTPQGLLGWTKLSIVSDVDAFDPGIVHTESYSGEAACSELTLHQSLLSLIPNKWWRSEIAHRFPAVRLHAVAPDGATLLVGDREVFVPVNRTTKLCTVPLNYASSELYVTFIREEGKDAINSRWDIFTAEDYDQVLREAEAGSAVALNHLAYLRYYGVPRLDLPEDKEEAHRLWLRAAELGNPDALFCIGQDYYFGENGVPEDKRRAIDYYRLAAEQDHPAALCKLGYAYLSGEDDFLEPDSAIAFDFFRRSAEQERQEAKTMLGSMYYIGDGVEQDYAKALELFRQTAYCHNEWAAKTSCFYLGEMYRRGSGVDNDDKEALRYYKHAADMGYALAMTEMGFMLSMGRGCNMDMDRAVQYWEQGVEAGEAMSAHYLSFYWEDAEWGNDPEKANYYQQLAADMGDEDAQREIELGLRPGEQPAEDPAPADAVDWEQQLDDTMSDPTAHARVIWHGACNLNPECLRRYAWVAYNCQDDEELLAAITNLADTGDETAQAYMKGKKEIEEQDGKFVPRAFYCLLFWDPDGSPYDRLYGQMAYSLFRLYSDRVGFFENDDAPEPQPDHDEPDDETVKWWFWWYKRDDCASNRRDVYDSALPYALAGHAEAQYIVGSLLRYGVHEKFSNPPAVYLEPDHDKAADFLRQAAEQGVPQAYNMLLTLEEWGSAPWRELAKKGADLGDEDCLNEYYNYLTKQPDADSAAEAARVCLRLVEQGDHKAMLRMAKRYETGDGIDPDPAEAFRLADYVYHHSSISPYDSSYEDANELLQHFYREGIGTPVDKDKAWALYRELKDEEDRLDDLLSR